MMRLMRLTRALPLLECWEMMFQTDLPVSRDKKVIHCALEELVQLLSKLRIMMVRFQSIQKRSWVLGSEI